MKSFVFTLRVAIFKPDFRLSALLKLRRNVLDIKEKSIYKEIMNLTDENLEKLEKLSALKIKESEKENQKGFLNKVLTYFETIKTVDTSNVPALLSPLSPPLMLREDQVVEVPNKEKLLDHASQKQGALVKVPYSL